MAFSFQPEADSAAVEVDASVDVFLSDRLELRGEILLHVCIAHSDEVLQARALVAIELMPVVGVETTAPLTYKSKLEPLRTMRKASGLPSLAAAPALRETDNRRRFSSGSKCNCWKRSPLRWRSAPRFFDEALEESRYFLPNPMALRDHMADVSI